MILATRPKRLDVPQPATDEPPQWHWAVRLVGTDLHEVTAAAAVIGAAVNVSRGGRYWFPCRLTELPAVRDAAGVVLCDFAGWLWWARDKGEDTLPTEGAFSVDLPDEPGDVQPGDGIGTVPS